MSLFIIKRTTQELPWWLSGYGAFIYVIHFGGVESSKHAWHIILVLIIYDLKCLKCMIRRFQCNDVHWCCVEPKLITNLICYPKKGSIINKKTGQKIDQPKKAWESLEKGVFGCSQPLWVWIWSPFVPQKSYSASSYFTVFGCHTLYHLLRLATHSLSKTVSVWKSSCKTGKRLRLDQTRTDQDWKFTRLIKTTTMVQSLVHHIFKVFKTSKNQSKPVSTGLSGLKCKLG